MLAVGLVGAALTLVVLGFGSLVPAMALDAIIDIGEGLKAWLVLGSAGGQHLSRLEETAASATS